MNTLLRFPVACLVGSLLLASFGSSQGQIKIKPGTPLQASPVVSILPISFTPNFSQGGQASASEAISPRLAEAIKTMTLKGLPFSANILSVAKVAEAMKSAGLEGQSFPLTRTNLDKLRIALKVDRLMQLEVSSFSVVKKPSSIGLTKHITQGDAKLWLSFSGARSRTDFTAISATGGATSVNMSTYDKSYLAGKMSSEIVSALKQLLGMA